MMFLHVIKVMEHIGNMFFSFPRLLTAYIMMERYGLRK